MIPKVGDLVEFDITWCEGVDSIDSIHGNTDESIAMFQHGIIVGVDSHYKEIKNGESVKRKWNRYYITWKGINLMFFGGNEAIQVIDLEEKK